MNNQFKLILETTVKVDSKKMQTEINMQAKDVKINADLNLKLDKEKLNNQIKAYLNDNPKLTKESVTELTNLQNKLKDLDNVDFNSAKEEFATFKSKMTTLGKTGDTVFGKLKSDISSNFLSSIESGVMNSVRNLISTVSELDNSLVDIQMATGDTKEQAKQLLNTYIDMGQELGATGTEVANAASSWLKQGKSISDTNTLIKDSMVLSKIGSIESADATKYLNNITKAYGISAKDTLSVVDKLSTVDLNSATDVSGLAQVLNEVSTNAKSVGVNLDELLGYAASIGETTGEEMSDVGNSLNAMFSRMANIKLNRLVDPETNEDLSNTETSLRQVGIELRTNVGTFRDFSDVLTDVASNWNTYNDKTKQSIATSIAGVDHINDFKILMQQFGKATEYTTESQNSAGTAMEKFSAYEQSIEAKTKTLQASLQELASDTLDSSVIKGFLDAANGIVNFTDVIGVWNVALLAGFVALTKFSNSGLTKLLVLLSQSVDALGLSAKAKSLLGLATTEDTTATLLSVATKNAESLSIDANTLSLNANTVATNANAVARGESATAESIVTSEKMAETATEIMNTASVAANTAAQEANAIATTEVGTASKVASIGVTMLGTAMDLIPLVAVIAGIVGLVKLIDVLTTSNAELGQSIEKEKSAYEVTASEITSLNTELKTNNDRINELQNKGTLTFVEEAELTTLKNSNDELERQLRIKQLLLNQENQNIADAAEEQYNNTYKGKTYDSNKVDKLTNGKEILGASDNDINEQIALYNQLIEKRKKATSDKEIDKTNTAIEYVKKQMSDWATGANNVYSNMTVVSKASRNATDKTNINNMAKSLDAVNEILDSTYAASKKTNIFNSIYNSDDFTTAKKQLEELAKSGKLTDKTIESNDTYRKLITETGLSASEVVAQINGLTSSIKNNGKASENASKKVSDIKNAVTDLSSVGNKLDFLDEAFATLAKGNRLDISNLTNLQDVFGNVKGFDKFISVVDTATSTTKEVKDAFGKLLSTYIQSSGILDDLTDKNKDLIIAQLKQMGVSNAETIVNENLAKKAKEVASQEEVLAIKKEYITKNGKNLEDQTWQEISAFAGEINASDDAKESLYKLALEKINLNSNLIDTSSDITQIIALANAAGASAVSLAKLQNVKDTLNGKYKSSAGGSAGLSAVDQGLSDFEAIKSGTFDYYQQTELDANDYIQAVYSGGKKTKDTLDGLAKDKSTNKFSETIDWTSISINNLTNSIDKLNKELDNTTSLSKQISLYQQLIANQAQLADAYNNTADTYEKKYEKALSKLSKDDQEKVKNGSYTIEQFNGTGDNSLDEIRYNNIQNALNWKDKLDNTNKSLSELKSNLENSAVALANLRWDKAEDKVEDLNDDIDLLNAKLDNAKTYEERNKILQEILDKQKQIVEEYQTAVDGNKSDAKSDFDKISNKYKINHSGTTASFNQLIDISKIKGTISGEQLALIQEYNAQIREYRKNIDSLKKSREDYKKEKSDTFDETYNNNAAGVDNSISLIEGNKQDILNSIDEIEAAGGKATEQEYKNLIALSQQEEAYYEQKKTLAENALKQGNLSEEQIAEYNGDIQDAENNISDCKQKEAEWNKTILEMPISQLEDANDVLQDTLDTLNKTKDKYDSIISAATDVIDDQIESIQSQIDLMNNEDVTGTLANQIKLKQDELNVLQDTNDEQERAIALQKAQYDLAKAQSQKTNRIYRDGQGFVYEADTNSIQDAQDELNTANYNIATAKLQDEIDGLNDTKDVLEKSYQGQIDSLNEIKDAWSNISNEIEKAKDIDLANSLFGTDWSNKLLTGDTSLLSTIRTLYGSVTEQIDSTQNEIDSNQEKIDKINEYVKAYTDGKIAIETAYSEIQSVVTNNSKELETTNASTGAVQKYGDEYTNANQKISDSLVGIGLSLISAQTTQALTLNTIVTDLTTFTSTVEGLAIRCSTALSSIMSSYQQALGMQKDINNLNSSSGSSSAASNVSSLSKSAVDGIVKSLSFLAGTSHRGMELGYIGDSSNDSDTFKMIALDDLGSDEVARILKVGEAVLTKEQQSNVLSNFVSAYNLGINTIPEYITNNHSSTVQPSFSIGEINITGVRNSNDLANDIKNNLLSRINQKLYS
jgi:phage tail tape measure protein, TP901 family, core region